LYWPIWWPWPIGTRGGWRNSGHLARLRPFPERKRVLTVDKAAVPAGVDQKAFEAERAEAALAFRDVTGLERIDRAQPPFGRRARHQSGDLVIHRLDDIERGRRRDRRHGLGAERVADQPPGDAGARQHFLLQREVGHLVVADRRQAAIVRDRVASDRRRLHRDRDTEPIARHGRRAVGVDVDDGHGDLLRISSTSW
jgi:hypothetical protein